MAEKKIKRPRRSLEERIRAQQEELNKLLQKQRAEELKDDPRLGRINGQLDRAQALFLRAKRTVNGAGRGKGAAARIRELEDEIRELGERLDRDSQVIQVAEDFIAELENFRDGIVSGDVDPDTAELPSWPQCMRYDTYTLTDAERAREAEARARAEQRGDTGDGMPAPNEAQPETETAS